MTAHRPASPRARGWQSARRDLLADWRRWSLAEKTAALATTLLLLGAPLAAGVTLLPQ